MNENTEKIEINEVSCNTNVTNQETIQKLTPEQKKTIIEWSKYIGKALLTAIIKKLISK